MADYTTNNTGGAGMGFIIAGAVVVLVLLYAVFAGGGASVDNTDPGAAMAPGEIAPAADPAATGEVAPVAPATE